MLVPHRALSGRQIDNEIFQRGEEWKRIRPEEEEAREGAANAISAYGITLAQVSSFKYLGRVMLELDDNWPAVVHNLRRAHKK